MVAKSLRGCSSCEQCNAHESAVDRVLEEMEDMQRENSFVEQVVWGMAAHVVRREFGRKEAVE